MPITPADLRDFAHSTATPTTNEVGLRAACSRAYYAGFHALVPFATQLPKTKNDRGGSKITHQELSSRLEEWKVEAICEVLASNLALKAKVCQTLDAARAIRLRADYKLEESVSVGDAKMQAERAGRMLRAVSEIDDLAATGGKSQSSG